MTAPDTSRAVERLRDAALEHLRDAAMSSDGGCDVMNGVLLCGLNGWAIPPWLVARFAQVYALVNDAHVRTWDEAIGPRWPAGVRLDTIRRTRHMSRRVHAAVWAELEADPSRPIDAELFGAAGGRVHLSASQTRMYYYRALGEGFMNLAYWKADELARRRSIPACGRNDRKDFQGAGR